MHTLLSLKKGKKKDFRKQKRSMRESERGYIFGNISDSCLSESKMKTIRRYAHDKTKVFLVT